MPTDNKANLAGKKILIIDDEFTIRYLVEHQLKRHDFATITAKNGATGLQAAKEQQPDLIVLDVMMPEMDGFDVCQRLKQEPDLADIPVIFLTALATKKDKLRAFEMGADDYLTKPFQADEFIAHVTAVLRRAAPRQETAVSTTKAKHPVTALYSPKGGVGTTTLAIQLSEALVLQEDQPVMLLDLDLPLGGVAPMLKLYTNRHVVDLLNEPADALSPETLWRYTQRHRANLLVVAAPGTFIRPNQWPQATSLQPALDLIREAGYQTVLDLGSTMTPLTLAGLRQANTTFVITSGQSVANNLTNLFIGSADTMGLETGRLMPVINELHGEGDESDLERLPIARIPHASERSRTRLWLRDQGMRKLVSVIL